MKAILLGLPVIIGPHTGQNIAAVLTQVINEYNIASKIGCFMMDNATNNDKALKALEDL